MFRNGSMNNKMPENQKPVSFGKNIDEKPQCKNLNKSNRKGRAAKSCKLSCNKSLKGKTLTNTDPLKLLETPLKFLQTQLNSPETSLKYF